MLKIRWLLAALVVICLVVAPSSQRIRAQGELYNCNDPDNNPNTQTMHDVAECEILKLVYTALDGPNWTNHNGWLQAPGEICGWNGIHCCPCIGIQEPDREISPSLGSRVITDNHHVNWIYLVGNNLSGALPTGFGNLVNLYDVDVSSNHITSLPDTMGNLTGLTSLRLSNNALTSLPSTLGNLINLKTLTLGQNLLTALPSSMGNLTQLTGLLADRNLLTSLPESICNLTQMTGIILGSNKLPTLPSCFGNLTALTELYLDNNLLTALPNSFGSLNKLKTLDIHNNFIAALPDSFGSLSSLETFWADNNDLTLLPASFGSLSSLTGFFLNGNQLATLPSTIVNMASVDPYSWLFGLPYNAIYITDPTVRAFLDSQAAGWEFGQTIPPTQIAGSNNGSGGALISWTKRGDTSTPGYYEIGVSSLSGGPYSFNYQTVDKTATSFTVNGLGTGKFYFVVRMITPHHQYNRHDLTSANSDEVSVTLGIDPGATDTPTPTATDSQGGTPSATPTLDLTTSATPTPSITPTVTGTPGSLTELLTNGSFEEAGSSAAIPAAWTQKQAIKDKRKCGVLDAPAGSCVYRFKGSIGENSQLIQIISDPPVAPEAGDILTLSGFVKAGGSVNTKISIKVKYSDITLKAGKIVFALSQATTGYQQFNLLQAGSLQLILVDNSTSIKVKVLNRSVSGKVQYDGLSLTLFRADIGLLPLP